MAQVSGEGEQLSWISGEAGRIRVSDGGAGGVPVVFVHSLAGNRKQWFPQLEHLRLTRRAVALDLRGHGESDKPADADYSLAGAAEDLATVVDALGLTEFVLIGHSFGGGVVATYAGAHPERVKGVLFADPIGDQRAARFQIDMLLQSFQTSAYAQASRSYYELIVGNAAPGVRGQVLSALDETAKEAVIGAFRSLVEFDPLTTLRPYDGPMLSVISDLNNFPFSLHNIIPNLPSQLISGTSHWLQLDKPDEFNRHMDGFLGRIR